MVTIVFESHATSFDNENHVVSGWNDVELSPLGVQQAKDLGKRRENEKFVAIFCSDLQRSYKTAIIAFGNKSPIIQDFRLRECDYVDLTQRPSSLIDNEKLNRITNPFPNGESYTQASERIKEFLEDLIKNHEGKKVMIIGHKATQYGLEHWIKKESLEKVIAAHWKWQPGWTYELRAFR